MPTDLPIRKEATHAERGRNAGMVFGMGLGLSLAMLEAGFYPGATPELKLGIVLLCITLSAGAGFFVGALEDNAQKKPQHCSGCGSDDENCRGI